LRSFGSIRSLGPLRIKGFQADSFRAASVSTRTCAEAYAKDPEFYSFLETLTSYEENLATGSVLILSTDGEYLKYLKTLGRDFQPAESGARSRCGIRRPGP